MSKQFANLRAWQAAKELTIFVYKLTENYPAKERFGLISQTTRAVISIAANIAEGSSRGSKKDFAHFLEIAIGSAFELETLLEIAFELGYINRGQKNTVDLLSDKVIKLTFGLKRKLYE